MNKKISERKEKTYKAETTKRVPEFSNIFAGILVVVIVSFGLIFIGMNQPFAKQNDNDNSMTGMAIGGMDSITGAADAAPPASAKPEVKTTDLFTRNNNAIVPGGVHEITLKTTSGQSTAANQQKITAATGVNTASKLANKAAEPVETTGPRIESRTKSVIKSADETTVKYTIKTSTVLGDSSKRDVQICGSGENPTCVTFREESSLVGSPDRYLIDDKGNYKLNDKKENIPLSNQNLEVLCADKKCASEIKGYIDSSRKESNELYKADYNTWYADPKNKGLRLPAEQARLDSDWNTIIGNTRGKINTILNAYFDEWLGEYTQGIPATVCGDSLYKNGPKSDNTKKALGITLPQSSFKSENERKILEGAKTVIIEGEKTEITSTLYTYAVTVKLIGGPTSEEWRLYLSNSCTGESSYKESQASDGERGWFEYGSLSSQQFFGNHYVITQDCTGKTNGENCRYNQVCIAFSGGGQLANDAPASACVSLSHGGGFISNGKTNIRNC